MQKNVIITGASGNLGRAAVRKFADAGYRVAAVSRRQDPLLAKSATWYAADLADEAAAAETADRVWNDYGSIDALICAAGGFSMGTFEETNSEALDKMYRLNFKTAYFIARRCLNHMLRQQSGGRMIFVGAKPAVEPGAGTGMLAYAFSKSLLMKLSEYINAAGSEKDVVSTVLVPSIIDTEENRKAMPKADFSQWVSADRLAETMLFFCSEAASDVRDTAIKMYGKI